jgi:hypothetical protein
MYIVGKLFFTLKASFLLTIARLAMLNIAFALNTLQIYIELIRFMTTNASFINVTLNAVRRALSI